jgi:hypothetical protein
LTTGSLKYPLSELVSPGTTKLLVAVQQMVDATAIEENNHNTLTIPGHQLEGLLRVAIVRVAPAEATTTPTAATVAGAPHTVQEGELAAAVITEAEATRTTTSPASCTAAMMPDVELKKYVSRRPLRQATTTASPPPLDFVTCFSQRNSNP